MLLNQTSSEVSQEIHNIKALKNVGERSKELLKLIDRVGPIEAQEKMLNSGMPFDGETHLLIHTIGDYIYDYYGIDGLPYCRDYFLSACYHGFIINTLGDHGESGVVEAIEKCNEEGRPVATQCAHATGHGFVAWHDYDLIKALKMCDEVGNKITNFGYFNCYDGVFMENMWGVHDGVPSEKRWVNPDDIYYPCNDRRIPEKYLGGCWANQASLIYQYSKGNFRKTAIACDAVGNLEYRNTCYNNLARQIHPLTNGNSKKVLELCANATGEERINECILVNMGSSWSVGDRNGPYEICEIVSEPLKSKCLDRLIGLVSYHYALDQKNLEFYCDKITRETDRQRCKQ